MSETASAAAIELRDVVVSYGSVAALRGLTLRVEAGSCLALVGPSGSGKSTALRVMNGMVPTNAGTVRVGGRSLSEWDIEELRRGTGYVIQDVGLMPHWTVAKNIETVPRLLGWQASRRRARALELLGRVGLREEHAQRLPSELSGGERQRVGIARALSASPRWLLMDEPFGALDPLTRVQLRELVSDLRRERKMTMVLVTHDLRDAFVLADRVAILRDGRVLHEGAKDHLLDGVSDPWVRDFVTAGLEKGTSR